MAGLPKILPENILNIDSDTIKHIYKFDFPIICKYIRELNGSEEDARDILQDVLVDLHTGLANGKIKIKKSLEKYLIICCINKWKLEQKKRERERNLIADYHDNLILGHEPEETTEEWKYTIVKKHISNLSHENKQLIDLM